MNERETDIRDAIVEFLKLKRIFCWKDRQSAKRQGVGTVKSSKGVADILGIYAGRPLAIEVKKPGGTLSQEQHEWLTQFKDAGGIAFIATSVEECQKKLSEAK